jgi:aspartyl aminopeptidase
MPFLELKKYDHHVELLNLLAEQIGCGAGDIIDFDLRTYAVEPAQIGGLNDEFVFSGRLDNLVGVYSSLNGLIKSTEDSGSLQSDKVTRIACCFDHEEVGSESVAGAQSAIFEQVLKRIVLEGKFYGVYELLSNPFR